MGFSHGFTRPAELAARPFAAAAKDCARVVAAIQAGRGLALAYESDRPDEPPAFTPELVRFNGVGPGGHETFAVPRVADRTEPLKSDWCKTNRKPYDAAVCACLLVFARRFPRKFAVETDADPDGDDPAAWPDAQRYVLDALGHAADLPDPWHFGPLAVNGMPHRDSPDGKNVRLLANGWCVVDGDRLANGDLNPWRKGNRRGGHRFRVYRRVARVGGSLAQESEVCAAKTLAGVAWAATDAHLAERLAGVPDADAFLAGFAATRDWAALGAWADKLAEEGHAAAERRLRKLLPRRAAGSAR